MSVHWMKLCQELSHDTIINNNNNNDNNETFLALTTETVTTHL